MLPRAQAPSVRGSAPLVPLRGNAAQPRDVNVLKECEMAASELKAKISLDDVFESAAHGVLRALDARDLGKMQVDRHGFNVDLILRVGGRRFDELVQGGGEIGNG